ncbi:hypothetical protein [Photobacterium atrarenae]|uniref:Uncharacterized protein n=1 Tax=Photobacterium atrarenae TaxID=865757 RepID=A0ABY5GJI7_9GAMM|nr:hypothetical protein [Photobacterium atrarenae]UTV29482.1 hypothetical protein NNL38_20910 [Photobacterium atrarenae]
MRAPALWLLIFLVACASIPEPIPDSNPARAQIYTQSQTACLALLTDFKQAVQHHGVQDAQLVWDPRFPHLAFNRFSLSWLPGLTSRQQRQEWLAYVTQHAAMQRQVEYQNLPNKHGFEAEQLAQCATQLASRNLYNPAFWSALTASPPEFPSGYSDWQRIFGVYPVSKHIAKPSMNQEKRRLISHFIQPPAGSVIRYAIPEKPSLTRSQIRRWFQHARQQSALSWPRLTQVQLKRLLAYYAPVFEVESRSRDDLPGQVAYASPNRPMINVRQPALYTHVSLTRFYGQTLIQLNYSLWFANRTARTSFDPYAGPFDGVLIRLTLDPDGNPYILDSIHHCGCYHMVFALTPALKFSPPDPQIEWPITLHIYAGQRTDTLGVAFTHGEHMLKNVQWLRTTTHARPLVMMPYHQLRSLPTTENTYQSLFNQQGMLPASVRAERFYLWPLGVKSPGTQRQLGHHATAFIGRRHFDDPFIFETLFEQPSNPQVRGRD